ncbi:DNA sulfur modification protein DndB [bacterium]|nr:DNA sulfur modification protein DndB [bacterium]
MNYTYKFPTVRGIQSNREYYISMIPMKLLSKLFPADEENVLPEYRAQRRINESRIPEIRDYILNNRNTYVFSALSASIDGNFKYYPSEVSNDIGVLEVDMDSVFLINDGQHRKAAIEAAIIEDSSIGNETISIVFFKDEGLLKSQQMFTDLNKHAVKTSNSLSTLYDSRDELAVATKSVIENVNFLKKYTDKERDILGKNSSNLFTLTSIYKANQRIIHNNECSESDTKFLIAFWNTVTTNISEWNELQERTLTKKDLRENYITTLAITINAFGRLGRYFYDNKDVDMNIFLKNLSSIDWLRSNRENWLGRAIRNDGKIKNNEEAVILTCTKIKMLLGIDLTKEEEYKEKQFNGRK